MLECAIHPITYSEGILATVVKKNWVDPLHRQPAYQDNQPYSFFLHR